ncbi:hypothetical protein V6N13_089789 [Hibiscus sabdariffa]
MLGYDNESYIGLIKHLCSEGEINIYAGHGLELDNANVGVEDIDVNDSGFNVEEVEVDDGPNVSPGPTVAHGPTVVDVEPTGVGGPSADAEPTGVAGPSTESPMEPPASQAGPSVAAKQTCVSGPTSVDGSTRLETDNVEVGEEDINEGRANDDDEESGDNSDLSYKAESESDSEYLRGKVWVTDDEDEELTQFFEKARRFKERRAAGTVGDEDLRQNEDPTGTFHGTEEREEGNAQDTDYLVSDDVGSYETDSDGEVVCKKTNRFDYKYTKNEKDRIRAKCKGVGCPFMIYLGKGTDDPTETFDLVVERPTPNDTPIFRRLYVCFTSLKEGFIRYCRPVLCLDGCYLKGPLKCELLAVVGRDGNNQIFPIAWAVVEVENKET